MNKALLALVLSLGACAPPPAPSAPSRAVIYAYRAKDGLTSCVDTDGSRWKGDRSCCPEGFSPAGFSVPSATELYDPEAKGITRHLHRHLICLQDLPSAQPSK